MQFDFGRNWIGFAQRALTPERLARARDDFHRLFDGITLAGKTFLDIGFGQGISLLLAQKAGALVVGNDINTKCKDALSITASFSKSSSDIPLVIGSILEPAMARKLAEAGGERRSFDIVHSWGVLHHTGNMKAAVGIASRLVAEDGFLVLAIYNRHWSNIPWLAIKWLYCISPAPIKVGLISVLFPVIAFAKFLVTRKNPFRQQRGMDFYYNVVDWVGGYPYEYAGKEEMIGLLKSRGFSCVKFVAAEVPTGCNEFVFKKDSGHGS